MKARLLYPDKDVDWQLIRRAADARETERTGRWRRNDGYFNPQAGLPWNTETLTADLALGTLFNAMAKLDDDCIFETARRVVLTSTSSDLKTIQYRQGIMQDSLSHPGVVRELYKLAGEALEKQSHHWMSDFIRSHPEYMLRESIELMDDLLGSLKKLHGIAESQAHKFKSSGWTQFFAMIKQDLNEEYLQQVEHHLQQLKRRHKSLLLSAELGQANKGNHYLLHQPPNNQSSWWDWPRSLLAPRRPVYSFRLHPRDESGSQALGKLRDRGIGSVASAIGQSADNVTDFFGMLQVELAFYVGCLNLHKKLEDKGEPNCMPAPVADGQRLSARGLYDVGLSLSIEKRVIGNDINAKDKNLVIITGANTGGKSTFLRSLGLAQLMMQSGMFVPAESFSSSLCDGLFTHYKREEDATMESGKFDEELSRMSDIVDHIKPHAMILFNESFAATNEREGSEIGRQIITALLARKIRVVCVTHLYELAHSFHEGSRDNALFLRAHTKANRTRTFKMVEGEPQPTSLGVDLYKSIFSSRH